MNEIIPVEIIEEMEVIASILKELKLEPTRITYFQGMVHGFLIDEQMKELQATG